MDEAQFTPDERKELIRWFSDHPVSRFWTASEGDGLRLSGFISNTTAQLDELHLLLEGRRLGDVAWNAVPGLPDPARDPDPTRFRVFRWWPDITSYGFTVYVPFDTLIEAAGNSPTLRIEIAGRDGRPLCDPAHALYLPMYDIRNRLSGPHPPLDLIERVMGIRLEAEWFVTGYNNFQVFDAVCRQLTGRGLASLGPVLEWGSGCGRVSRHLIKAGCDLTGIDIDAEGVGWCNANLAPQAEGKAKFVTCGLFPPTPLPSEHFGLAIGVSVITHLDQTPGNAWLEELARVVRPGGIVLLTTHGLDTFSMVSDARIYRAMRDNGFASLGSHHLDAVLGDGQEYYRETWHAWEYIRANWSRWFIVEGIRRGGHMGYQDLVVLRRE